MGYGFVEYKNRSDALQAIKQLQVSGNFVPSDRQLISHSMHGM